MKKFDYDVCIIGGAGHVGLPLGITFADVGFRTLLIDLDPQKLASINQGKMPFIEYGAEPVLKRVLKSGRLKGSTSKSDVARAKFVITTIGTPIDQYLNPSTKVFLQTMGSFKPYLSPEQVIIIRSTVFPNTCAHFLDYLNKGQKSGFHVAYCPERIAEGYAIKELRELPQIVSGFSPRAIAESKKLFSALTKQIIELSVREAELAKLFTNAWRYIQFAVSNQFYMIAQSYDTSYDKIRNAMTQNYRRIGFLPGAGFAAGPCLLKDTMQLASFYNNHFFIGQSAMMINEGLPNFVIDNLARKVDLKDKKVGILGMTFKSEIDDIRDSLSFKLVKLLQFHGAEVLCSDEYASDAKFVPKETIQKECKIVVIGVPHKAYRGLKFKKGTEVVDLWGVVNKK